MTPEEQETMVQDLETALDRLQALYNQYFMGIERLEPTIQRKDVERKMQALRKEKISNTALRFRFQTQVQKFNTQSNYWKRISRQIEEGTYQRDVNRAQKRSDVRDEAEVAARALSSLDGASPSRAKTQPVAAISADLDIDIDDPFADPARAAHPSKTVPARPKSIARDDDKTPVPQVGTDIHAKNEQLIHRARLDDEDEDLSSFFSKRPSVAPPAPASQAAPQPEAAAPQQSARAPLPRPKAVAAAPTSPEPSPPRPTPKMRPVAPAASASELSEERMQAIYRSYVAARKKTNEPTDNVSYAKISALLKKQISEKSDVKDFKVVIRDGKAIIKTVKD